MGRAENPPHALCLKAGRSRSGSPKTGRTTEEELPAKPSTTQSSPVQTDQTRPDSRRGRGDSLALWHGSPDPFCRFGFQRRRVPENPESPEIPETQGAFCSRRAARGPVPGKQAAQGRNDEQKTPCKYHAQTPCTPTVGPTDNPADNPADNLRQERRAGRSSFMLRRTFLLGAGASLLCPVPQVLADVLPDVPAADSLSAATCAATGARRPDAARFP